MTFHGTPLLRWLFVLLAVLVAAGVVAGFATAWRRSEATRAQGRRATMFAALGVGGWMVLTALAASAGWLRFDGTLPSFVIVPLAGVAAAIAIGVSPAGARLSSGVPLALLVGFQGFRLPLELLMHRAWQEGLMPVQMSYAGRNWDIVTGATALLLAGVLAAGRPSPKLVQLWNWLGLALLANAVIIAVLSLPLPFRVFLNEPANVWVANAPWVWVPGLLVPVALLGHLLVLRRVGAFGHPRRRRAKSDRRAAGGSPGALGARRSATD